MSDVADGRSPLAGRASRLGGEGVFTSAAEANAAAAAGQKVYPFHLGNVGFSTPSNIVDAMNQAIRDGHTGYCQNEGIPELREAIAWDVGSARDLRYGVENVAVQPGGSPSSASSCSPSWSQATRCCTRTRASPSTGP